MIKRLGLSTFVAALMVCLSAGVASATPQGDRDGDADSNAATMWTEGNDSDGVGDGIVDEGDNAHPSGKDRSVENGKSGNQGKSESKPDQNGKGPERDTNGTDKPNGPGGSDIFDQDGNNGCGNDDDFDDDNEGWCGKKPRPTSPPSFPPSSPPVNPPTVVSGISGSTTDVLGVKFAAEPTQVLGVKLARTGSEPMPWLLAAMGLIALGTVGLRVSRKPAESRI